MTETNEAAKEFKRVRDHVFYLANIGPQERKDVYETGTQMRETSHVIPDSGEYAARCLKRPGQ